ncbi:MAG: hypothetical protein GY771_16140 [bacterium]|nr:hypothetical protein [bacterium]
MRVLSLLALVALTAVAANAAFTQELIFEWNTDMGYTYESHDVSGLLTPAANIYFEWNYDTTGHTWDWGWAIDNVYVYNDDGDLLPTETFDTWLPTDWYQEQNGLDGLWENDVTGSGGYLSGNVVAPMAICDSDGHNGWAYDASLFSETILVDDTTGTYVEFDSDFQDLVGYDWARFYLWHEEYVGIESASLGEIKAAFK